MKNIFVLLLSLFFNVLLLANNNIMPDEKNVYKKVLKKELFLHIFYPEGNINIAVSNALILYSPVLDKTKNDYDAKYFNGNELFLSPNHSICSGLPPTLIMHETGDKTVPYKNALNFKIIDG